MARLPVYLISAPIGSYLSDMAVSSLRSLESVHDVFIESEGRLIGLLRKKGTITAEHRLHVLGDESVNVAEQLVVAGRPFAILADTGTPCFVDPGYLVVRRLLDRHLDRVHLVPLGMSSALDAALACCGLDIQRFAFVGHHPETADYTLAQGNLYPVVLYVAGVTAGSWVASLEAHIPGWKRVTLFRNLRDRSNEGIARFRRGEPVPDWVRDDSSDNYVAVVERGIIE